MLVRRSLQKVYHGTDQLIRILEVPRVIKGRWGHDDMINTTRHWREEQQHLERTKGRGLRRHQEVPTGRNFVNIQWMMSNFESVDGKQWSLALDLTYPWCPIKFDPDFVFIKLSTYQRLIHKGVLPPDPREHVTETILQIAT
jgi:hypothetical protein